MSRQSWSSAEVAERFLSRSTLGLCVAVLLGCVLSPVAADDFAIRDGDTVVFLGDSITAARTYGKIIENYTLLRFPERRVRFFNAGKGGDTAAGGFERLEQDVFARGATMLTVAFGTNDIGWGVYADDAHKQKYLTGIRGIVEACKRRGVRVYICSAAVTAADPEKSESSFLQTMCDEGMQLARELGGNSIDVQREMRTVQKRVWAVNAKITDPSKKHTMHAADGAHLNDLGQLAMAFAILKGLNAPTDVSAATIDAADLKALSAENCTISEITDRNGSLSFTRHDRGLPFNYGLFYPLHYQFVPVHQALNAYQLTIKNLAAGQYEVAADGRRLGKFSAAQLAQGLSIASHTADAWQPGGPWNAQANALQALTDSRHELAIANVLARAYVPDQTLVKDMQSRAAIVDDQIIAMQRELARPRPYRFEVSPVAAEK